MKKNVAIKVYKLILREINGWSQDRIDELSYGQIECDPIFEELKLIEDDNSILNKIKQKAGFNDEEY